MPKPLHLRHARFLEVQKPQASVHTGSHRSAGDFLVIEDETELRSVTQALCLKPKTHSAFFWNLHLPARLQRNHCQQEIKRRAYRALAMPNQISPSFNIAQ